MISIYFAPEIKYYMSIFASVVETGGTYSNCAGNQSRLLPVIKCNKE
jgi:hypothetical protein